MVSRLSDAMKLSMSKVIAKDHGYYVVEIKENHKKRGLISKFLLYRRNDEGSRGVFVGKRSSCDGILALTKSATGHT